MAIHHLRSSFFKNISTPTTEESEKVIFFLAKRRHSNNSLYLIRLEGRKFETESLLEYPCSGKVLEPLSSCDGLFFLLADDEEYMLWKWNPLIGKHINIPAFNPNTHPQAFINLPFAYSHACRCHLYHDSITDDYKILFLYRNCYTLYSCNNGRWEQVKLFPGNWDIREKYNSACVDGCLYLYVHYIDNDEIIYFDARDGKMHKFPQPEGVECLFGVRLKAVSGRLCLYGYNELYRGEYNFQLWVMENKNGNKCWRKLMSMDKVKKMRPVFLTEEDDVVLLVKVNENGIDDMKPFIYNSPKNCSFQEIDSFDSTLKPIITNHLRHVQYFSYSENLYMSSPNIC